MIETNENTLGGRIRLARASTNEKIKDLAEAVGITPNYLGLIERGAKKPSLNLLRKISENTGVSYTWLLNGSEKGPEEKKKAKTTVASLDLRMLLSLILIRTQCDKEFIAELMDLDTDDIEKILSGEPYDYDPQWENVLPTLSQSKSMGLDSLIEQLEKLTDFFRDRREDRNDRKFFISLKQYIEKITPGSRYQLAGKIETKQEIYHKDEHGNLSLTTNLKQVMLQSLHDNSGDTWLIKYYTFSDMPGSYFIKRILDAQLQQMIDGISSNYALIFENKDIYYNFIRDFRCRLEYIDLGSKTDDCHSDVLQPLFFILIEKETREILEIYPCDSNE